ncbi:MAG: hypothetical protein ABIO55_12335 [Ginsengibacter sp.]
MSSKKNRAKEKEEAEEKLEEELSSAPETSDEKPARDSKCKCKQKKNGKFYCFKLQQGGWVQVGFIPFETQEDCEIDCCDE